MSGSAGSYFQQTLLKDYEGLVKIMPLELIPYWKENKDKQKGFSPPQGYCLECFERRKKEENWQELRNI